MSKDTDLGRLGTYNEDFHSIKSPDHLITWSCKVTYNILAAGLRTGLMALLTF